MITKQHYFNCLIEYLEPNLKVVLAPDYSGCSIISILEIIKKRKIKLNLIGAPTLGFQADILIGAGFVNSIECAAINIGEYGPGPRFKDAFFRKEIKVIDSTCPAIHSGLQASEKGIPFMPIRGIIGSELIKKNKNWIIQENPFTNKEDPIVLVKAIKPDIAIFHAPLADKYGNVWIGKRRELMTMAHASQKTFVTFERMHDGNLLDDNELSSGTIPSIYVSNSTNVPLGSWPVGLYGVHNSDNLELKKYLSYSKTEDGFMKYIENVKHKSLTN